MLMAFRRQPPRSSLRLQFDGFLLEFGLHRLSPVYMTGHSPFLLGEEACPCTTPKNQLVPSPRGVFLEDRWGCWSPTEGTLAEAGFCICSIPTLVRTVGACTGQLLSFTWVDIWGTSMLSKASFCGISPTPQQGPTARCHGLNLVPKLTMVAVLGGERG